jgi:NAD(P)-dependent dehydrogenase (short-subunit alcohol dehydrogenase family)
MRRICRPPPTLDGDEVVLNGRKWWSSGAGHPDCKVGIFMAAHRPERRPPPPAFDGARPDGRTRGHGRADAHDARAVRRAARSRRGQPGPMCGCPSSHIIGGAGARLRDRPGPARPGARAPLHAPHRPAEKSLELACERSTSASPSASRSPTSVATASGSPGPDRDQPGPAARLARRVEARHLRHAGALSRSPRSRRPCPRWPATSSISPSSCTAVAAPGRTSRSPRRMPGRAPCAWPTAPTRSTSASWLVTCCKPYAAGAGDANERHPARWPSGRQPMSRVLVTGGASGLGPGPGRAHARSRETTVLVGDLAEERPDSVPEGAAYRRLDVRSQQDWDAALAWVREDLGRPRPALQQRRSRDRRADRRRVDVGLGARHRHQPARRGARVPDLHAAVQGAGERGTSSTLPRSPGSCTGRGCRATTRPRRGSWRCRRPCLRAGAVRSIDVSVVCPAFFRTNLHQSFSGEGRGDARRRGCGSSPRRAWPRHRRDRAQGRRRGKRVILTDRLGRQAYYWTKRFARPLYDRMRHRAGRKRLARRAAPRSGAHP